MKIMGTWHGSEKKTVVAMKYTIPDIEKIF